MTYALTWMPAILRAAGLMVIEVPGWQSAGHGDFGPAKGIICHHTACGHGFADMPSEGVVEHGRPDLPGPLCNLLLGRSGHIAAIAAGRAWHAGPGAWKGDTLGNSHFIGIEAENAGDGHDDWPAVQIDAFHRMCAALLKHIGAPVDMCIGHKEWAPGRKIDPDFDMNGFRARVELLMRAK